MSEVVLPWRKGFGQICLLIRETMSVGVADMAPKRFPKGYY